MIPEADRKPREVEMGLDPANVRKAGFNQIAASFKSTQGLPFDERPMRLQEEGIKRVRESLGVGEGGSMKPKKQWTCLTLHQEDIERQAIKMGIAPNKLTEEDLNQIADFFMDSLGSCFDDWPEVINDALNRHLDEVRMCQESREGQHE